MKWFDSFQYKPKHGTMIFIWDRIHQKQVLLNAFWDEANWIPSANFPIWSYIEGTDEPLLINQPERASEKTPEKEMRCAEPDGNTGR